MKVIKVYNIKGGAHEEWDYEVTRQRYGRLISSQSPAKDEFTDGELVEFLTRRNAYCAFSVIDRRHSDLERLKIQGQEEPAKEFERLADLMLNHSVLRVADRSFRLVEVEIYYHSSAHPDPYVQGDPLQMESGAWYLHRKKPHGELSNAKRKALSITIGDGRNSGSILIRAIDDGKERIEGPASVVDHLIQLILGMPPGEFKGDEVAMLAEKLPPSVLANPSSTLQLWLDQSMGEDPIHASPRVGLSLRTEGKWERLRDAQKQFVMKSMRFLVQPEKVHRQRDTLFLSLWLKNQSERLALPEKQIARYIKDFEAGKSTPLEFFFDPLLTLREPATRCQVYGAWTQHQPA